MQQTAPGGFTLSVKARIVTVTANVRDKHGALVRNLKQSDFTVREDGKPQTLRYFDNDNDLPVTLGLLVDTSHSQDRYATEVRRASHEFLQQMLTRPQDRAFVERFDYRALLLQGLTSNLKALDKALDGLVNPPGTNQPYGTVIWDALIATSDQIVSKEPGRKALIVMTDGEDVGSKQSFGDAVRVAQLFDVPVYTILYTEKDPGFMGAMDPNMRAMLGIPTGPRGMEIISQATGGKTFHVTHATPVETIFAAIEEDLRTQYRLGYTPPPSPIGMRHTLEVKVDRPHVDVQSREAYYTAR